MMIGIDCRFANTSSGLGRYTRELVTHLLKRKDGVKYVLFVGARDDQSWLSSIPNSEYRILKTSSRHYSFSEQWKLPLLIKRSGIDLYFSPHFNVPYLCPVPFIATIHDLILHRYPNQASSSKQKAYRSLMKRTVTRARSLIAVSTFTGSEIAKEYGKEAKKKTVVIHEAVSSHFAPKSGAACAPVMKKYSLQKPFFLYVGNAKEHKNVQMLVDAYASLGSTETELVLVTGGKEIDALRMCPGTKIIRDLPESELPCLYFFATCFVTASLYEGFGLPVLEAAASGCPVIVTNRGALPEIAPSNAHIVEPTVADLADALREPPSPSDPGPLRTWTQVAEETAKVLLR